MSTEADVKRELLAALLRERAAGSDAQPLSYGQKALWFLHQIDRHSPAYNTAFTTRITGLVDITALQAALQRLTTRHPALRTTFSTRNGETFQHVRTQVDVQLRHEYVSATPEVCDRAVVDAYRQPFDLENGPVMRATLFSRSPEDHVLLIAIHHIVCDAWSLWILADELERSLSYGTGADITRAPPARSYSDFVRWQLALLDSPKGEELLRYWRTHLDSHNTLTVPADHARPALRTAAGASYVFELPAALLHSLQTLATAQGTTLYTVLLAAFEVLLHRYSYQEDFTLGTLASGRTSPEYADVVGYFANPVVIRARVNGDMSFATLLAQVRETVLGALAHQDCPFSYLVERLTPPHDPSRTPFMDVLFVYQKRQTTRPDTATLPLQLAPFEIPQMEGQFDLTLEIAETGRAVLKYASSLFERSRIARMALHFENLLRAVVANSDVRVSAVTVMSPPEREHVLTTLNRTAADFRSEACLHELFEEQARRTPDNLAVRYEGRELTYRALNDRANGIARRLQQRGVGPETIVGVGLERSLEMPVALLGVLKAGGAYLPLDPSHPSQRLEFMARTAGAKVVLSPADLQPVTNNGPDLISGATPENLAYVIYTSGSTGDPKGAMNTHRAICNRLEWMQHAYRLRSSDRVLQKTPLTFDVSVWEFFWPLLNGAAIVMARPGGHSDSAYLVRTMRDEAISVLHFVPSMLRPFLEQPDLDLCGAVRLIFCSGEALTIDLHDRCQARLSAELHNLYGPTEAAIDVTHWPCERRVPQATVPIGRPIANTQIYVLDRQLQPVPLGIPGELCIGGVNVGRGYVNRPDLTAERFIPNPYGGSGARMYRTGDVGRFLEGGAIEFLGRVDHQVKLRGVRIELAEIESALLKHPRVQAVAAVVWNADGREPGLVAYFVASTTPPPSTTDLRQFLSDKLPQSMIPELFEPVEALPLTSSGKVDRRRLPVPRRVRPSLDSEFESPQTDTETVIAGVWQTVLQLERVGIHDNFFDLGGHSLRMAQVISLLDERLGRPTSMVELFKYPTVHSLAAYFSRDGAAGPGDLDVAATARLAQRHRVVELRTTRQLHRSQRDEQDANRG